MDTALFTFSAFSLTASVAAITYLFCHHRQFVSDQKARDATKSELTAVLKKVTDEHGKIVLQVAELFDRMGMIDMKISGVGGKPAVQRKF